MKNLVIIVIAASNLTDDWEGWSQIKMAKRLKVIDFSRCTKLRRLPYFPKSLEVLILSDFNGDDMQELDIGELKKLKVLVLADSNISKIIGGTFGTLKGLRELDLYNFKCKTLSDVVFDVGKLASLKFLKTLGVENVEFQPPTSLKKLSTSSCVSNLAEQLELEELYILDCEDGLDIPWAPILSTDNEDLVVWWKVSKLKSLTLSNTNIYSIDSSSNSTIMTTCPPCLLPSSLTNLQIEYCQGLWLPSFHNLENLTDLTISDCQILCDHMDGLEGMKSLRSLEIDNVDGLTRIQGLGGLLCSSDCKLEKLNIASCYDLTEVLQFELDNQNLIHSLQQVWIFDCPLLEVGLLIRGLSKFPMLKEFGIYDKNDDVVQEEELKWLCSLKELVHLDLPLMPSIERIPWLSRLQKLIGLTINAPSLREIEGLGELKSLERLHLKNCSSLERIPSLSRLQKLRGLIIADAPRLRDIEGLGELKSLGKLNLKNCLSLERMPSLSMLQKLWGLTITIVSSLQEIEGLGDLKLLERLHLENCPSLERIPSLSRLQKLTRLTILEAPSLREIDGLGELKSLECLVLLNCSSLERLWPANQQLCTVEKLKILFIENCEGLIADDISSLMTSLPNVDIHWPDELITGERGDKDKEDKEGVDESLA